MNLEVLSPESIAKFLEEQEGVKDDFTKPHELCINKFGFQRKGRDETLHKIYDCIVKRYISIKNTLEEKKSVGDKSLHPVLALQATPGGGKSFLLDEFAALKSEDFDNYLKSKEQPNRKCPFILENAVYHEYIEIVNNVIDILRNSIVICITYNGNSTYKNDSPVDANVQRGLVMRILWSYFFDDAKLSWQGFCEKFNTNFESLDIYIAVQSILYHSKKRVFLCVDETMKISPNTDDVNRRERNINEILNNLYSPYQGLVNDKGKLINFNFILTTLDAVFVRTNSTYSGRTIDWVPLRRLDISESTDLFHKILNDKELNEKRKYLIRKCISDCNGHPRTLEKFYELLREDETALSIDMYGSLISRLVKKILSSLSYIKFSIIKTALLGNSTDLTHNINTLNREYSISDLISIGVYINSLTKVEETVSVVPTLTLISIQYFCNMYEEEGKKEGDAKIVVEILKDMLETECYFDGNVNDGKPFESFHCNWEQLYRVLREEGKEVSLREVYRLSDAYNTTTKGDVEIMLQRKKIIKLDRGVEFPPRDGKICGEQGVFINKNFEEYIFVPEKTNNSGFDMTIFEKKVGGGHIALNIECRFSYPERSTTLTSKEIREKYDLMKEKYRYHVKQEKNQNVTRKQRKDSKVELVNSDTPIGEFGMTMEDIYLVIIAWRDINALDSDIKNNKNIIIVGKDSLEKAYTPTLVTRPQFYDNMLQDRDKISQEVMERVNKRYINYQSS